MISCQDFFDILNKYDLSFFTGIPDSTFKEWMKFLVDKDEVRLKNLIACNECEAVALAAGYHLATNKVGVVYMQNSGLGKSVNPLTSLCDPDVFSIPALLMIGWRGEPGKVDAPQHKKMGKITLPILETLQIPYWILEPDLKIIEKKLKEVIAHFEANKSPYAFIVRKNLFQNYDLEKAVINKYTLLREEAISVIMQNLNNDEIIVSSTGFVSRELYEYRESNKKDHYKSFYNIGSMGCASSIGLSIALQKPNRKVIVFDGDGAAIMQMGTFTTIGKYAPSNYLHFIFDNQAHESTGGQPTNSDSVGLARIALASNFKMAVTITTKKELIKVLKEFKNQKGPLLILIKTKKGTRSDLKRPDKTPIQLKEEFMNFLNSKF
jgi:phosphonopyruvate decarboxylase